MKHVTKSGVTFLFVLLSGGLFSQIPLWWIDRNVIDIYLEPNDFAPVNQGQAKQVALQASFEFEQKLGGVSSGISNLISGFTQTNNYLPLNLGQLKYLATPFYNQLHALNLTNVWPIGMTRGPYPWSDPSLPLAQDHAIANIGQLKYLFSFNFERNSGLPDPGEDRDRDNLPDYWEIYFFGDLSQDALGDYDQDGLTNGEEIPVRGTYRASTNTFNWVIHSNLNHRIDWDSPGIVILPDHFGDVLCDADDEGAARLQLDFPIPFFEKSYSTVYATVNGLISLKDPFGSCYFIQPLPLDHATALIAPFWSDLVISNGEVRYGTRGVAPNRSVVISWKDVSFFDQDATSFHFQAELYEGGCIEFRYKTMLGDDLYSYEDADGNVSFYSIAAAVGIQNEGGGSSCQWVFEENAPGCITNRLSILFTPQAYQKSNPASNDTDGDGMDDLFESKFEFLNPLDASDALENMDGDYYSNLEEYNHHTNPEIPEIDSDSDGIIDPWEVQYGFDPFDEVDAYYDADGDKIINLYEFYYKTNPYDPLDFPLPTVIVTPEGLGGSFADIQAAIDHAGTVSSYPIVRIDSGHYVVTNASGICVETPNILIYSAERTAILDGQNDCRLLKHLSGKAILSGLQIVNGNASSDPENCGGGILSVAGTCVITGCIIEQCSAAASGGGFFSYESHFLMINTVVCNNDSEGWTGGITGYDPDSVIINSTIIDNESQFEPGGIEHAGRIINSIVWNNFAGSVKSQIYTSTYQSDRPIDQSVAYSAVEQGYIGVGNTEIIPPLSGWRLTTSYGLGTPLKAPVVDIDGESRSSESIDLGADECTDRNANGMADWWESHYGVSDPEEDLDRDGLSNVEESIWGISPSDPDSDDDGCSDGDEVLWGSSPCKLDTDLDGMPDGYEWRNHLNPTNALDAYFDLDGDLIPNLYEAVYDTSSNDKSEMPAATVVVNSHGQSGTYGDIESALTAVTNNAYPIVLVEPGIYSPTLRTGILLDLTNVLIYATNHLAVIDGKGSSRGFNVKAGLAMLSGLVIENCDAGAGQGGGIFVDYCRGLIAGNCIIRNSRADVGGGVCSGNGYYTAGYTYLYNCVFDGNSAVGHGGASKGCNLVHCTIVDTAAWSTAQDSTLKNCLVWRNQGSLLACEVAYSCVQGNHVGEGNSGQEPSLQANGWRLTGSYAIGHSNEMHRYDIDGDMRITGSVDVGADQLDDLDHDGLPDWWELFYGLSNPNEDADSDGLSNREELRAGSDPTRTDTDGDGVSDANELERGLNPACNDTDKDQMPDGYELFHGFNPNHAEDACLDRDGDHIPNVYEYIHGTLPTDALSLPAPTAIVSTNGHDDTYSTLGAAITAVRHLRFSMILLEPGIHDVWGTSRGESFWMEDGYQLNVDHLLIYSKDGAARLDAKIKDKSRRKIDIFLYQDFSTYPPSYKYYEVDKRLTWMFEHDLRFSSRIFTVYSGTVTLSGLVLENGDPKVENMREYYFWGTIPKLFYGGAVYVHNPGKLIMDRCIVQNCTSDWYGGAVYTEVENSAYLYNSVLQYNEGYNGSAIYKCNAVHCTLLNNASNTVAAYQSDLKNCILWSDGAMVTNLACNSSISYSCVRGGHEGVGNSSNAPVLMWDDWRLASKYSLGNAQISSVWDIDTQLRGTHSVDTGADELIDLNGNGLSDDWEMLFGVSELNGDPDGDTLSNFQEFRQRTHPRKRDTDEDGLSDYEEARYYNENWSKTDPRVADTDGDLITDGYEITVGLNPIDALDQ